MAQHGVGLYIVGDEILSGKRQDKHFAQVQQLLLARGVQLNWVQYLGDDPALQQQALRASFARGDIAFSCGGIGATPDDHTRQSAAAALGVPLVLHPEAEALILQRIVETGMAEPGSEGARQRLQMGAFPLGSAIIPNPYNRIPGFAIRDHYFVPGFPVMAWPMIEWVLDHKLAHLHRSGRYLERSLILPGAMESDLTPLMQALEAQHPTIKVFSLPSVDHPDWGRHIELGVKGEPEAVGQAFDALKQGVHDLGAAVRTELVREV